MTVSETETSPKQTAKYKQKRERIIDAATRRINQNGVKGMTIVDVAADVDLNTASVTYYFKKKEMLATAAFLHSLEVFSEMIAAAAKENDARNRVAEFLRLNIELRANIRLGNSRPITLRPDIRALDEDGAQDIQTAYEQLFAGLRAFFERDSAFQQSTLNEIRAHIVMENMFWLPAWIAQYSISDFDRLNERLFQVLDHGLAGRSGIWKPTEIRTDSTSPNEPPQKADLVRDNFLRTATRLMNERGYHGASVDRIAAELNVTKGSFYHHIQTKDELVLECFRRSYTHVSEVQNAALHLEDTNWQRLSSCLAALLDDQLFGDFQLMRTTAILALPPRMRIQVVDRSNRLARRFAGMLSDCFMDSTIAPCDPLIASQVIMSAVNGAYEMRTWATGKTPDAAVEAYAMPLVHGLFSEPTFV